MKTKFYEAPELKLIEVAVEAGFAQTENPGGSTPLDPSDWQYQPLIRYFSNN